MAPTDDAIARVQAAVEAAQAAAQQLTDALADLPTQAAAAVPEQVAESLNQAAGQAQAGLGVASEQIRQGASALAAAAKSAADRLTSN